MYLGILEAIRGRLEGREPGYVPALGPLGALFFGPDVPVNFAVINEYMQRTTTVNYAGLQVPIFLFDVKGLDVFSTYPALTFECIDIQPRTSSGYVASSLASGSDIFKKDVPESVIRAKDGAESIGTIPRMAWLKEHPKPYNFMIEVRAYSRDPVESALLVDYVSSVLPFRGPYLRVPQKDGTVKDWRITQSHFQDADNAQTAGVGSPGLSAEYLKVWTFDVRGFRDNTDTWALVNLIKHRKTTLEELANG